MTPFQNVFERFSLKNQDYILDRLFALQQSTPATPVYDDFLSGLLRASIPKFVQCVQSLGVNYSTYTFNVVLSDLEEEILACIMKAEWFEYQVADVRQISNALSDTDFKRFSEAQNMTAKEKLYKSNCERYDKLIVEYGYANVDFTLF